MTRSSAECCGRCRHFAGAAVALEAQWPLLRSLSSAYASVRAGDGLCSVNDRYVTMHHGCGRFEASSIEASST